MDIKALPQSELLIALIEQSETVFNIKDLDGKYLFANNQTRHYFSDPDADYLGKTDFDFFPTEIASRFREADLKVIKTKKRIIVEEVVNVTNPVATHLSVKFPIYSSQNNLIATGMFTTDITKRKHQEDNQLSALEKYQNLIAALGEIIYEHYVPEKKIIWSGAYQDILGYTSDEMGVNDSGWLDRVHPDDLISVEKEFQRAQKDNLIFDITYRFRARDDKYLWFHDRGIMSLDDKNNLLTNTGVMKHITENVELSQEQENLQRQVLQVQKMDALGHLTGGIAHDFNNILSSIRGYTELSINQVDTPNAAHTIEKYLNEVITATDRAAQLVQQMLAFSRGKTGTPELITPESGIHDAIRLLHAMIPSSISLEFSLKHHHRHIKIDPVNLQQVLINLIINARDAIHDQTGEIHIELDEQPVSKLVCSSCHENIRSKMISISVKDNGEGIASTEILDRIFDPFFTTKAERKGSGMGLSVVHGIMHSCGGHILVTTEPGEGTCFVLLFPESFEMPTQVETAPVSHAYAHRASIRENDTSYIMVVDDEVTITSYLSELLQQNGLQVISFNDPTKALAAFKTSPETCNLIITDQTMPELTGDKLAAAVLDIRDDIPVIMCSGYSDIIDQEKAIAVGIAEYIEKPIDKNYLLNTIYKLLRTESEAAS